MVMAEWIHKYPQVLALLQQDDEALCYAADGEPPPAPHIVERSAPHPATVAREFCEAIRVLRRMATPNEWTWECRMPPARYAALLAYSLGISPSHASGLGITSTSPFLFYGVRIIMDSTCREWVFRPRAAT